MLVLFFKYSCDNGKRISFRLICIVEAGGIDEVDFAVVEFESIRLDIFSICGSPYVSVIAGNR
jgi:hypothetical protein